MLLTCSMCWDSCARAEAAIRTCLWQVSSQQALTDGSPPGRGAPSGSGGDRAFVLSSLLPWKGLFASVYSLRHRVLVVLSHSTLEASGVLSRFSCARLHHYDRPGTEPDLQVPLCSGPQQECSGHQQEPPQAHCRLW